MSNDVKCIAFDLGKVLFDFDYFIALDKIGNKIRATKKEIIDAVFVDDYGLKFEKGLLTPHEFYDDFVDRFGADIDYDSFEQAWCEIFTPFEDMINFVKKVKAKYPIYMISNLNVLHYNYLYRNFRDVFSLFDDLVLSFKVKTVKPETKIYDILRKMSGVNFNEIVYIDDRQDLIEKAKLLDLRCIRFDGLDDLISELKKHNVFI